MTVDIRARAAGFVRATASDFHGRRVILVDAQGEDLAGALSPSDGHTIAAGARYALDQRLPLVILLASSGSNLEEGVGALDGWGGAAREITRCSGIVPTIVIVSGPTVSGPALMLGLADVVIMVEGAYAFVSGPAMVEQFTGVPIDTDELGGASVHGRTSGVASMVAADMAEAEEMAREVLGFLPDHTDDPAPTLVCDDPVDRLTPEAYEVLPESANGSYDSRDILTSIVDDGFLLELHEDWAANLVTCFATIGGQSIGIVANQPQTIAGTLNITASRKGARFVALCDAFNVPLLTLVDTSGFYPGKDLEWRGMIRHGAQLAFAYARATVPRICVVLRKSYGGAYIVMDSKTIGNDVYFAWPTAELAVMGANQAAQILRRGADQEEVDKFVFEYEETYLNPYVAAERGYVDAVINPAETRSELVNTLMLLETKREPLPRRRHDNSPL